MLDDDAPPVSSKKAAPAKVEAPKKPNTRNHPPVNKGAGERQGRDARGDGESRGRGRGRGEGGRGRGGEGRGRGAGRGRGRGGGARDGKREFDRHESGTGRDRGAKKGGAGKYNWGTEGDQGEGNDRRQDRRRRNDRPAAETTEEPSTEEAPATEEPTSTEEQQPVEKKFERPVEPPEPEVQTYEEYLEELEAKKVAGDDKKLRVVENDDSQWKSASVAEVEVLENDYSALSVSSNKKDRRGNKSSKKTDKLSLDEFKGSSSGGRGRGRGRGGARGGRGGERGAPRNFDLAQTEDQFPTLGGK